MLKHLFRILMIVIVMAVVAGAIYLIVEKTGLVSSAQASSFEGQSNLMGERSDGPGGDGTNSRPEGQSFEGGGNGPHGGDRPEGDQGFSSRGWAELGLQAGKIALITLVVVLIQVLVRLIQKRRRVNTLPIT